jgi:hypothetical protein
MTTRRTMKEAPIDASREGTRLARGTREGAHQPLSTHLTPRPALRLHSLLTRKRTQRGKGQEEGEKEHEHEHEHEQEQEQEHELEQEQEPEQEHEQDAGDGDRAAARPSLAPPTPAH